MQEGAQHVEAQSGGAAVKEQSDKGLGTPCGRRLPTRAGLAPTKSGARVSGPSSHHSQPVEETATQERRVTARLVAEERAEAYANHRGGDELKNQACAQRRRAEQTRNVRHGLERQRQVEDNTRQKPGDPLQQSSRAVPSQCWTLSSLVSINIKTANAKEDTVTKARASVKR